MHIKNFLLVLLWNVYSAICHFPRTQDQEDVMQKTYFYYYHVFMSRTTVVFEMNLPLSTCGMIGLWKILNLLTWKVLLITFLRGAISTSIKHLWWSLLIKIARLDKFTSKSKTGARKQTQCANLIAKQLETVIFVLCYLNRGWSFHFYGSFIKRFCNEAFAECECCLNIWNKMHLKE